MIILKNYNNVSGWQEKTVEGYNSFAEFVLDKYLDFEDNPTAAEFEQEFFNVYEDEILRNEKPLTEEDAAFWWEQINGRESQLVEVVGGVNNYQIYFQKNGQADWKTCGPVRDLDSFNRDFSDWVEKYGEEKVGSWSEALEVLNTVGASALAGKFCLGAK